MRIVMLKGFWRVGILVSLSALAGLFFSSDVLAERSYTLANDYRNYTYSEYRAKRQYDKTLQIKILDDRGSKTDRSSPKKHLLETDETFWMEPIPQMVEQMLQREFALSFLFQKVDRAENRDGLVLELVLNSFHGYIERVGLLGRSIHGDVAFSARLLKSRPRKTLFTKDYHSHNSVKVKSIVKSGRQTMVKQIGKAFEEVVPVLMSDIERVLKGMTPLKKRRNPPKRKSKPLDLEPVGPK